MYGFKYVGICRIILTPCCTLSIQFTNVRFDNLVNGIENAKSITPKIIEFCIKDAKNKGCKPEINGKTFEYKYDIDWQMLPY